MSNWQLKNFDDEILSIQPECDMTFEVYGKAPDSLAGSVLTALENQQKGSNPIPDENRELNIVAKIKEIGQDKDHIGRRLTVDDITDEAQREKETILMLRNAGCVPSVDTNLNSKTTIPAITSSKPYTNSKFPILFNEEYFKLVPRKSNPTSLENSVSEGVNECATTKKSRLKRRECAINLQQTSQTQQPQSSSNFSQMRKNIKVYTPKELFEKKGKEAR